MSRVRSEEVADVCGERGLEEVFLIVCYSVRRVITFLFCKKARSQSYSKTWNFHSFIVLFNWQLD